MKTKKSMDSFAISMVAALAPANVVHLGWTVWLTAEQLQTGWGGGTGIEMLALMLWLTELLCLPVLILGVAYFVTGFFRRQKRGLLIANILLFVLLIGQIAVTNLFLYY